MSHYEVAYPRAAPIQAAQDLFQIFRAGEIQSRKSEAGIMAYNIQGFGQAMLLGNPDGPLFGATSEEQDQLEVFGAALDKINQEAADANPELEMGYASSPMGKVDWKAALQFFIKFILPLLLKDSE